MSERIAAISLKIPDNTAYTTLTALRRLGVDAAKLERSEVWLVEDSGDAKTFAERIERNETIFNPNKHRLTVLESAKPRAGEAWIEEIGRHDEVREHMGGKVIPGISHVRRYVGWRMFAANGTPVSSDVVSAAVERLLCNPAIEKALL
jgi:hypothetical protein